MTRRNRGPKRRIISAERRDSRRVSIIGAGRLGAAFAIALRMAGHSIELVVTEHAANARKVSRLVGGKTVGLSANQVRRLTADQAERLQRTSLFIISTPDDAIAPVSAELAAALKPLLTKNPKTRRPRIALHTSGALTSKALKPLKELGFSVGSLHPLVSISDSKTGAEWLTRAYFSVEGDAEAIRSARTLVRGIGGRAFEINAESKALYHAAALMASPNMTALFDVALEMLTRCGLSRSIARKVLLPLVGSTLHNLTTQDPSRALTGTFKRGDVATVRKHIDAIQSQDLKEALAAYVVLGRHSMKLAARSGKEAVEIDDLLATAFAESRKRS